eukprot:scaffold37130_cov76-Phaeocystis_antarctica.AAC.1
MGPRALRSTTPAFGHFVHPIYRTLQAPPGAVGLVASCEPAHSDPAAARPVARRERLIGLS